MKENLINVWVTRYALTQGIIKTEAELCSDSTMISYKIGGYTQYAHNEGKDWHRSKESAIEGAEEMRTKKISSLKKKITKLEKLIFKTREH